VATERFLPAAALPTAGARTITSPFQFLVTGEDHLRVRAWSSRDVDPLVVSGRAVGTDGTIQIFSEVIALGNLRVMQTRMIPLAPGYVLSIAAEILSGFTQRGQCFVQIDLVRGLGPAQTTLGTLLQGYVASLNGLAYPGSPIEDSLSGPGFIRTVVGTNVGPGIDWLESMPNAVRWRLLSLNAGLTTSGAGVPRGVFLFINTGLGGRMVNAPSQYAQPAAQTIFYQWVPGQASMVTPSQSWIVTQLPFPMVLMTGDSFYMSTTGLDPGDDWTAPTFVAEEWINIWV
jgi:hypothetical protein